MKTIRKIVLLLLTGVAACAFLVSCGGGSDAGTSAVAATGKSDVAQSDLTYRFPITCGLCGHPIIIPYIAPTLEWFAGNVTATGSADGPATAARFANPNGIAADSAGNIYVADTDNFTIRKITAITAVSTLAGTAGVTGSANGTSAAASFNNPLGVAADSAGNVYVADEVNYIIRKITPAGVVTTFAGTPGVMGSADGTGAAARFNFPAGVATDSADNVYVTDSQNDTIRKITPAGVVTTLAGAAGEAGSADGTGAAARFSWPTGIATDSAGNIYIGDSVNCTIRKITPAGVVTTLAGAAGETGSANGAGAAARFGYPFSVATDNAGNVYVGDTVNQTIRKITPAGLVTTLVGTAGITGGANGTGAAASFDQPYGIATDSAGNVYVADAFNNAVRKITPDAVVTTLAGTGTAGSANGTGLTASFNNPSGIGTDRAGNVYVADTANNVIRKIFPAGTAITLAGSAGVMGSANGIGSAASFYAPYGVAVDSASNVYVADSANDIIRKITPAGAVTTLAGTAGEGGSANGTGAAARFFNPYSVATDSAGNVYVADTANNTIRKITPAGVVTTLAGTPGVFGSTDGTGSAATFGYPTGLATDSAGNVYVADTENFTIRKITPAGVVTTLAGTAGVAGHADGTGNAASFYWPTSVSTDSAGNVYAADYQNFTVREITPAGVVTTLVGVAGQFGFIAGNLPGGLAPSFGIAISGSSLYIQTGEGIAVVSNLP